MSCWFKDVNPDHNRVYVLEKFVSQLSCLHGWLKACLGSSILLVERLTLGSRSYIHSLSFFYLLFLLYALILVCVNQLLLLFLGGISRRLGCATWWISNPDWIRASLPRFIQLGEIVDKLNYFFHSYRVEIGATFLIPHEISKIFIVIVLVIDASLNVLRRRFFLLSSHFLYFLFMLN